MILPSSTLPRRRALYAGITLAVLLLGLASRRYGGDVAGPPLRFVRLYMGDALWAMMVFFGIAFIAPRLSTRAVARLALAFSFGIELSQLYHVPWLDALRATRLGGLVLGYGFLWTDLLCYVAGVGLGALIDEKLRNL